MGPGPRRCSGDFSVRQAPNSLEEPRETRRAREPPLGPTSLGERGKRRCQALLQGTRAGTSPGLSLCSPGTAPAPLGLALALQPGPALPHDARPQCPSQSSGVCSRGRWASCRGADWGSRELSRPCPPGLGVLQAPWGRDPLGSAWPSRALPGCWDDQPSGNGPVLGATMGSPGGAQTRSPSCAPTSAGPSPIGCQPQPMGGRRSCS